MINSIRLFRLSLAANVNKQNSKLEVTRGALNFFFSKNMTLNKNNPKIARSQFKEDLEVILNHKYTKHFDWKIKPNIEELSMNVNFWSFDENHNKLDDFYTIMDLTYYRTYPPGVIFVNPETREFNNDEDLKWLPKIGIKPPGINIQFHPAYDYKEYRITKQLVCNSMTLEYYMSGHNPKEHEKWDPMKHNLFATMSMLQMTLKKPYYEGRMG